MAHPIRRSDPSVDARILHWLATYPLQQAEDLVLGLARWCARPTVYRHLAALETAGLITIVPAATRTGARLYVLSAAGWRWWNAQRVSQPTQMRASPDALQRLLPRIQVLLPLQAFLNQALLHLSDGLTHQGRRPTLVRWNWLRDYTHSFTFREHGFTLRTDAAWVFGVQGWQGEAQEHMSWFACFLLYHPLTEARLMLARLDRLLRWRESAERWAHYQAMPPVLILATSRRQAEWWQFCAEKVASRLRVDPPGGAILCLEDAVPDKSPWQTGWRRLVSQEHVHLRDLFQPLLLDSLPQKLRPVFPDPLAIVAHGDLSPDAWGKHPVARHTSQLPANLASLARATKAGERLRPSWLSTQLSQRQWEVLTLLFAHPLLSCGELAAFLRVRHASARLLLCPMAHWGIVAVQDTDKGKRWYLSELGIRLLAAAQQVDVRNLTVSIPTDEQTPVLVQRGLPWLQQHVRHMAGVYSFFARLAETSTVEREICWWETGRSCERRYQRQDGWHNFRPDALAEYRVRSHSFRFWLEWDQGSMNERDLRRKFASYAYYLASHEWIKERTPLPWLLCVTPDVGQERRLIHAARALVASTTGLALYTTTAHLLHTMGPLAALWMPVLPVREGQTEHPLRSALFSPTL